MSQGLRASATVYGLTGEREGFEAFREGIIDDLVEKFARKVEESHDKGRARLQGERPQKLLDVYNGV